MKANARQSELRDLASVGALLDDPVARELAARYGREIVREMIRSLVESARQEILAGQEPPCRESLLARLTQSVLLQERGPLRRVINATGIVLHTNLGRAPLGKAVIAAIGEAASGYCNLELDLETGRRGERSAHARELLRLLTGAEDALVVNNNAAALLLALSVLAKDREVIVSRGELIEIGGAFRLPELMAESGARMIEVGTTNRTRLADYERAIGPDTALIFKAHQSNYSIVGFTEEATVRELAGLARARGLPLCYDQGSGLLRRPSGLALAGEPDVRSALNDGADLVAFSGDKLLGGPQAGILVGRSVWMERLAQAPLMRALRVDKLTYAALLAACRGYYCEADEVEAYNPTFAFLSRGQETLEARAMRLKQELEARGVEAKVVGSGGQCGGGALPNLVILSAAVEVLGPRGQDNGKQSFAERLYGALLKGQPTVLCVLREGRLVLDVLALFDEQTSVLAEAVVRARREIGLA